MYQPEHLLDPYDDLSLVCVGERRIRVHTMCLPVTNQLSEVMAGADQQAIVCLLSRMGKSDYDWQRSWQGLQCDVVIVCACILVHL